MKAVPEGFPDKRNYAEAFTLPSYAAYVVFSHSKFSILQEWESK